MQKHTKIIIFVLHVINGADLIRFVQDYFDLSFKNAIKKINYDFNLNLNLERIPKQTLKELEFKKQQKQKEKQEHNEKLLYLCKTIITYEKLNKILKSQLTPYNWEEIEEARASITNHLELLNEEFDTLNVKIY